MSNEFPIRWFTGGKDLVLVDDSGADFVCQGCYFDKPIQKCPRNEDEVLLCCSTDGASYVWKEVKPQDNFNGTSQSDFETMKKENPEVGKKYDAGKPMYGLLPADALEEVVKVLTYGALKYNEPLDQENWRLVPTPQPRYFNAVQRHLWANKRGEHFDPESGLWHLAHAISSQLFMLQLLIEEQNKKDTK